MMTFIQRREGFQRPSNFSLHGCGKISSLFIFAHFFADWSHGLFLKFLGFALGGGELLDTKFGLRPSL